VRRKEKWTHLFVRQLAALAVMFLLGVGLSSCASTYVFRDKQCQMRKDLESLASVCLKLVEHTGPVTTVVVPIGFDSRAQRAFSELRPVVAPEQVPLSKEYALPQGYFELHSLHVDDAGAVCSGTLGPALRPTMPGYADNCGAKITIPFSLEDGSWKNHSYKITTCSSSNYIVPKD